jgi:type II secretory pathway component PulK
MSDLQEPMQFLTPEESAEVDQALLTSRDKFLTRVAIYSLRSLKQLSQQSGLAIENITAQQIADWIENDESLRQEAEANQSFGAFFTQLVLSSLKPLRQVAESAGKAIAELTPSQVIAWFEQEAKAKVGEELNSQQPEG